MNGKAKSLRWIANQIPDFTPDTESEKMLLAIKRYSTAGADEIERIGEENGKLIKKNRDLTQKANAAEERAEVAELALDIAVKLGELCGDKDYYIKKARLEMRRRKRK